MPNKVSDALSKARTAVAKHHVPQTFDECHTADEILTLHLTSMTATERDQFWQRINLLAEAAAKFDLNRLPAEEIAAFSKQAESKSIMGSALNAKEPKKSL
jgi:hypothetical protein